METQLLDSLKFDPRNPRTLSQEQYEKLEHTLTEFGDLSGIVKNVTTGELVGGHQRVQIFKNAEAIAEIKITQRFDQPTRTGTIAVGYVVINGEFFGYRMVQWDVSKQRAANIAANAAGGEFDRDMLAETVYELSQLENGDELLALTAIEDEEMKQLLGENKLENEPSQDPDDNRMSFRLNAEQYRIVEQALATMKSQRNLQVEKNPDTDGNALYYICEQFLATSSQ